MNNQTCPYLGILGPETEQNSGRDYPSFENCCFAESEPSYGSLLLADQSTYCLSGGHHQCPRFQSVSVQLGAVQPGSLQSISGGALFPQASSYQPFQLTDVIEVPTTSIPLDSEYLTSAVDLPDYGFESEDQMVDEDDHESFSPVWLLAGTTFVTVFLAGIGLALFLGWHLISNSALAGVGASSIAGSNAITLDDVSEMEDAVYVVHTATPDASAVNQNGAEQSALNQGPSAQGERLNQPSNAAQNGNGANAPNTSELAVISEPLPTVPVAVLQPAGQNQQPQVQPNFPAAVTPTPIVVNGAGQVNLGAQSAAQSGPSSADPIVRSRDVTGPNTIAQNVPPTPILAPTPVPEINVQVLIPEAPTRRATPAVPIIPTVVEVPTDTPVPTATWPPPIVFFSSIDRELKEGKCTKLTWDVQNVRSVYVASLGVDGKGEKEVCIKDKSKVFDLSVVLPNGSTKLYTTTVELEEPTPTPTPTWTYTPLPIPTATWTPVPPTITPEPTLVPVLVRGAMLDTAQPLGAEPISCSAGSSCQIGLLATNSGEGIDNLVIVLAERSQPGWPVLLCRQDGVCSADRLILTNVGQANTAFITLQVEIPANGASQVGSFKLFAASQESGEAVRSDELNINIAIP